MLDPDKLLVKAGKKLDLAALDTAATGELDGKSEGAEALTAELERLAALQYRLHASGSRALLIVLQGMDTSGKDGVIRHLAGGLNPQGCEVSSFKVPTEEERLHDFLWRYHVKTPVRGRIGVFNRSHYEDVLVVRVHPKLAPPGADEAFWKRRFEQIAAFESLLAASGTVILKFFLHISKEEQRRRLLKRIDEPEKNWKFTPADVEERRYWDDYQKAYADALAHTSAPHAPWYVIPADKKWFARVAVAKITADALEALDLRPPALTDADRDRLEAARRALCAEAAH